MCAQGLGYSPFDMELPSHPPIEGDTKIHYVIYKGMSHPFSCSMSSET
jgi:hypothetical protein